MVYECDVCDEKFDSFAKLGGHRGAHTRRGEAQASTRQRVRMNGLCPDCGQKFETSFKLAGHRRLMHSLWESFKTDGRRKARLLLERGHRCEVCGITEWCGKRAPIQLEHKDGNPTNHDKSNLQLICPNCHAQTDTYCGRNIGRPKCQRREKEQFPLYRSEAYIRNQLVNTGE